MQTELQRLELTRDDATAQKQFEKPLIAWPLGDEATMSLVVSQFFSWLQSRILSGLSATVANFKKNIWFSLILKLVLVFILGISLLTHLPFKSSRIGMLVKIVGTYSGKIGNGCRRFSHFVGV